MSRRAFVGLFIILSCLFVLLAVYLGENGLTEPASRLKPTPYGTYAVDPFFHEAYMALNEGALLGPAISPMGKVGQYLFQYFENGTLMYDPSQPENRRIRLYPLGQELVKKHLSVSNSGGGTAKVYEIDPAFEDKYWQLGGKQVVGNPLTGMIYNPVDRRYEQYFENLAFYMPADSSGEVSLLAIGSWSCPPDFCLYRPEPASAINAYPQQFLIGERFAAIVEKLGVDLTGRPITPEFVGEDEQVEQVFENVVLYQDPSAAEGVSLRALPELVGMTGTPPTDSSQAPGYYFVEITGGKGYNIPKRVKTYIDAHGGIELFGNPIGEWISIGKDAYRQCFEHLCLEYHTAADVPDSQRIRPAALGYDYYLSNHLSQVPLVEPTLEPTDVPQPADTPEPEATEAPAQFSLQIWEANSNISTSENQIIGVFVGMGKNPLKNLKPIMWVTMPDGKLRRFNFQPTGDDGISFYKLPLIKAPNATIIEYKVCVKNLQGQRVCKSEGFMIGYVK